MPPSRVMFIRHAEKPDAEWGNGVTDMGDADPESLTVRGWQRAGALARFFAPLDGARETAPNVVYASKVAKHSESQRPQETVKPLVDLLGTAEFNTNHLKDDLDGLVGSIKKQSGIVLVAWEHQLIPSIVQKMSTPPPTGVPSGWPDARFDIVWILEAGDATGNAWTFSQRPQMLLAGDSDQPISDTSSTSP